MWETSGEIIAAVGERVMPMGTTPKVHPVGLHVFNLRPQLARVVANQNKNVAAIRAQVHVAEIPSPTRRRQRAHNLCLGLGHSHDRIATNERSRKKSFEPKCWDGNMMVGGEECCVESIM